MFKILFAGLLFLIFTQNIYAFTKVNVKYKEVSETAYEEGEQIFTRPYFLEKGNQWKIIENGKKIYAKVNLGIHEDPVDVELPLTEEESPILILRFFLNRQVLNIFLIERKWKYVQRNIKRKKNHRKIKGSFLCGIRT